jgi:hypothetical protein
MNYSKGEIIMEDMQFYFWVQKVKVMASVIFGILILGFIVWKEFLSKESKQ